MSVAEAIEAKVIEAPDKEEGGVEIVSPSLKEQALLLGRKGVSQAHAAACAAGRTVTASARWIKRHWIPIVMGFTFAALRIAAWVGLFSLTFWLMAVAPVFFWVICVSYFAVLWLGYGAYVYEKRGGTL